MAFLIDECLHTSLIDIAHAAGHAAYHVVYLGLQGAKDYELLERAAERDLTLVTNNAVDFRRLYRHLTVHSGLVILVPNVSPRLQQALFSAALDEVGHADLINAILEIDIRNQQIVVSRFDMPAP